MPANYVLLERIELNASAVEDKLFDLARKGNKDAYVILGYVLDRTETDDGCWVLGSNNDGRGYTVITVNKRRKGAHRLLLECLQESLVPEGMVVDHTCHNKAAAKFLCSGGNDCKHRACFNPNHMEVVTQQINIQRGSRSYWNQKACPQGHDRTEENTFTDSYNRPNCWPCHKHHAKNAKRAWRIRQKELTNAG
jgi:hypothetical protein